MISRETRKLLATAVLAVGVPAAAAWWIRARTDDLADHLTEASGVPVTIGRVDADLGGSLRIADVALGELVHADAVEGSVGMSSLLAGQLRADEIRVDGPRVAITVDPDGDSDLARVARRLATRRSSGGGSNGGDGKRLRRVAVVGGKLTAKIAGVGELSAEGVELVPDAGGVRILTGPVRVKSGLDGGGDDRIAVDLAFDRSASELALPQMHVGRALAVGGAGTVTLAGHAAAGEPLLVRDLAVGRRGGSDRSLEIRASVDDDGAPRALAIDLTMARDRATGITVHARGERVPLRAFAALAPHALHLTETRATGSVILRRDAGALVLAIDGNVEHLVVDHATVAAEPLELAGRVRAELAISRDAIAVSDAGVALGPLELAASGWIRRHAPISGQLDLKLAPIACTDLLGTVPEPLRGPLDGMVVRGTIAGRARLGIDLAAPAGEGTTVASELLDDCVVTAEPPAADVSRLGVVSDQRLADGTRRRIGPGETDYTPLRGLPAHVAEAFVAAEDGRFFQHTGFDLDQIARSLEIDLRERRLVRGGSTISQQLVKNAFLTQRRSFDRKLQEAILTWRLEERLAKKQILERYLNIIELGPHVFGITAAARYWFDATPRELTVKQAAFLAALTAAPASMSRRVRRARGLDPDSAERVAIVLRAMRRTGALGAATAEAARTAPLEFAPAAIAAER